MECGRFGGREAGGDGGFHFIPDGAGGIMDLSAFICQIDAVDAAIIRVGAPFEEAPFFETIDGVRDGGALYLQAVGEFGLGEAFFFPDRKEEHFLAGVKAEGVEEGTNAGAMSTASHDECIADHIFDRLLRHNYLPIVS